MENTCAIEFDVVPTAPHSPLSLTVELDDKTVWQSTAVTETSHVRIEIDQSVEAEHSLRWILANKTHEHTVVDSEGNIVSDSMIQIQNLTMDDINLTAYLYTMATYTHDFNGTGQQQTDAMYADLGCNGVAELKFSTPVYLWLLEKL
jgi:hypothetical protein